MHSTIFSSRRERKESEQHPHPVTLPEPSHTVEPIPVSLQEDKKAVSPPSPGTVGACWYQTIPSSQPAQQGCWENSHSTLGSHDSSEAVRAGHSKQTARREAQLCCRELPQSHPPGLPLPASHLSFHNTGSGGTGKASLEKVFGVVFIAGLPRDSV